MRRWIGLWLIFQFVFMCIIGNEAGARESVSTLSNKARHAVILIKHFNAEGKSIGQGTGFFITEDGLFVTNHHMLGRKVLQTKGVKRSYAKTFEGKQYLIKETLAEDPKTDVAIGRVELPHGTTTSYLKLYERSPIGGQDIIVVGNPKGLSWTVSTGIVSAFRRNFHKGPWEGDFVQITAPVTHGSSGSPVMNMKGLVIGVEQSGLDKTVDTARGMLNFASASRNVLALRLPEGASVRQKVEKLYLSHALDAYNKDMAAGNSNQDYAEAGAKLAAEYRDMGRTQEAKNELEKALTYDPNFVVAHYDLARIYWKRNDKEAYEKELTALESLDKKRADRLRRLTLGKE